MPISSKDFMGPDEAEYAGGSPFVGETGDGAISRLWVVTPEGGGPLGGRDASLTALSGVYRRRRFSLEDALVQLYAWDRECCVPAFGVEYVKAKTERFWVEWLAGTEADLTPEGARGIDTSDFAFMTMADMAAYEAETGAMTWLLENVLPEGGLVYLSAPPAGAKTWVMLDLVRSFVTGALWMNKYELARRRVLYLDEEMGVLKALPRLRKLGMPDTAEGFWYTNKVGVRFDNPAHVQKISAHCEANNIRVVFVDTLTRVHGLDENDNSQMRRLFKAFSVLLDKGILVIVAHHDRKKGADESVRHERMRGAGEIAAMADMAYSIDKVGHMFKLTTSKGRLVAEDDQLTVDFVVEDNDAKTATQLREVSSEERSAQRDTDVDRKVMAAACEATGPMTMREFRERVKARGEAVSSAVKRLAADGKLELRKSGRSDFYAIPGNFNEEEEAEDA